MIGPAALIKRVKVVIIIASVVVDRKVSTAIIPPKGTTTTAATHRAATHRATTTAATQRVAAAAAANAAKATEQWAERVNKASQVEAALTPAATAAATAAATTAAASFGLLGATASRAGFLGAATGGRLRLSGGPRFRGGLVAEREIVAGACSCK